MRLSYKTRGNSSPQGKSRVYISGHPDDQKLYFQEISDDILAFQNCAVYYDADPYAFCEQEELIQELEQIQLLVLPVTSRFLYQQNRCRDIELKFAMERHIPVLPLMQEDGLEEEFNAICGDIQILNKHNRDQTALSFEEKLKKFLDLVLIGDDLAERVRAAFDAYVFLSYRKKDRKYARELMRIIHKNEFCAGIAIWYDEFLVPGEEFHAAIAEALKKCSLFTIAVTPHILEENNYVMTREYPEAVRMDKEILPVEMVPTDRETLQRCFQDIPICKDGRDANSLPQILLDALKRAAICGKDPSPEHNYLIGLAYLNGIDVEVDRIRAVSLIESAAEDNLPEAMRQMAVMYWNGDGTEHNGDAAIHWQERLAVYWQKKYEANPVEGCGRRLVNVLCELAEYEYELSRMDQVLDNLAWMGEICLECAERFSAQWPYRFIAAGLQRTGDILLAQGNMEEAEDCFRQSLEIMKELEEDGRERAAQISHARAYFCVGNICRRQGKTEEAEAAYREGLCLLTVLNDEGYSKDIMEELSFCYVSLGDVLYARKNCREAEKYYLQAIEIDQTLWEETQTSHAGRNLSVSYNQLGILYRNENLLKEAETCFKKAWEIDIMLWEKTGALWAGRNLVVGCVQMAHTASGNNKLLSDAERIAGEICDMAGTVYDFDLLAAVSFNRSFGLTDKEEAKEAVAKALGIWEMLCAKYPAYSKFEDRRKRAAIRMEELQDEELYLQRENFRSILSRALSGTKAVSAEISENTEELWESPCGEFADEGSLEEESENGSWLTPEEEEEFMNFVLEEE